MFRFVFHTLALVVIFFGVSQVAPAQSRRLTTKEAATLNELNNPGKQMSPDDATQVLVNAGIDITTSKAVANKKRSASQQNITKTLPGGIIADKGFHYLFGAKELRGQTWLVMEAYDPTNDSIAILGGIYLDNAALEPTWFYPVTTHIDTPFMSSRTIFGIYVITGEIIEEIYYTSTRMRNNFDDFEFGEIRGVAPMPVPNSQPSKEQLIVSVDLKNTSKTEVYAGFKLVKSSLIQRVPGGLLVDVQAVPDVLQYSGGNNIPLVVVVNGRCSTFFFGYRGEGEQPKQ